MAINVNKIKELAQAQTQEVTTSTVIDLNNIFSTAGEFVLTEVGYHTFKVTEVRPTNTSLTLVGQLLDDNDKPKDKNFYRITIRVFGDGNIFRQQYRDILEQIELPIDSNFSVLPKFKGKQFVVRVTKNAMGYANYGFNLDLIVKAMAREMNEVTSTDAE